MELWLIQKWRYDLLNLTIGCVCTSCIDGVLPDLSTTPGKFFKDHLSDSTRYPKRLQKCSRGWFKNDDMTLWIWQLDVSGRHVSMKCCQTSLRHLENFLKIIFLIQPDIPNVFRNGVVADSKMTIWPSEFDNWMCLDVMNRWSAARPLYDSWKIF